MKATVYPRNIQRDDIRINPYIADFIHALERNGIDIVNPPHKNPLFSLLFPKERSDVYIFHWLENVPDYKHGFLQTLVAIFLLLKAKLKHQKIVWFLHNKQPHATHHRRAKNLLIGLLLRKADLIVTHATEGIELVRKLRPEAVSNTVFLHHPTKDRIGDRAASPAPQTDLLIWGNISPYKGVTEFLRFAAMHTQDLRIKVIGRCSSDNLYKELSQYADERITVENKSIPFQELEEEARNARFILIPYAAETVLSSGVLMDSLSLGARVIGPRIGSFYDYAQEPLINVYTFESFDDIPAIVRDKQQPVNTENYHRFLREHSWKEFGKIFAERLING